MRLDPKPKRVRLFFHSSEVEYDSLESLKRHFDYTSVKSLFGRPFFDWIRRQDEGLADALETLTKTSFRKLEVIKLFFAPGTEEIKTNADLIIFWLEKGYVDNARNYLRAMPDDDVPSVVLQSGADRFFSLLTGISAENLSFSSLLENGELRHWLNLIIEVAKNGNGGCGEALGRFLLKLKGTDYLREKWHLSPAGLFSLYELLIDYRIDRKGIRPEGYDDSIRPVSEFFTTAVSIMDASHEADGSDWPDDKTLKTVDNLACYGNSIVRDFYRAIILGIFLLNPLRIGKDAPSGTEASIMSKIKAGAIDEVILGFSNHHLMAALQRVGSRQELVEMLDDFCYRFIDWLQDV